MGYIGMCRCKGYGFKQFVQARVYKSEHLGLEQGIISQETDQLAEDFIQTRETATLGQGGLGKFTLVQGSKIQLNQLCYRLRVPGSQRHIPTQKFLKYPLGVNDCNIAFELSFNFILYCHCRYFKATNFYAKETQSILKYGRTFALPSSGIMKSQGRGYLKKTPGQLYA